MFFFLLSKEMHYSYKKLLKTIVTFENKIILKEQDGKSTTDHSTLIIKYSALVKEYESLMKEFSSLNKKQVELVK